MKKIMQFVPVKKLRRFLIWLILFVGLAGFIVPFVIFWRGEYIHIMKSSLIQGETCPDEIIPNNVGKDAVNIWDVHNITRISQSWLDVDNDNLFYMFSSYYIIARDRKYILLIGAIDKRTYEDLQCVLHDNKTIKYVPATYMALWDDQLLCSPSNPSDSSLFTGKVLCRFSPAFFTCTVPEEFHPAYVSLSRVFCKVPNRSLKVVYPTELLKKFTICVAPIYGPYDNVNQLIEMIELNRILGADYFTFYVYSMTERIHKILKYYNYLDLVNFIQWDVPIDLTFKMHYYGQMAALNDCLYRNRHTSRYIVVQDIDEFIIPNKFRTWSEMMLALPYGLNVYSFQSVMFSIELSDVVTKFPGKNIAMKYGLNTLLKQRHGPVYDKTTRTKYIVEASRIEELGIHNVWRLNPGSTGNEYHVPPEDGLMFHYRQWFNYKEIFKGTHNSRMMMYKDELIRNVKHVHEKINI